ncbi:MAG: hypothetical protein EZS28_018740 [Streblomastix strix]|uniref:Uncharacterized protein n=1 Tax=Streblomastix strix TaxID=222440 RepID=A0A5J4VTH1_9EUKA|nr:MAG: hypothetical protein EZS28_018740 [Streblomastix strix]
MQIRKISFEELKFDDQNKLIRWKDHIQQSQHQQEQLQQQINNQALHEATFQIDYKENYTLAVNHDQTNNNFFDKAPVICISAVVYKGDGQKKAEKKVITIFSSVLNDTGAFSLLCIKRMFESSFMKDIDSIHYWSDGGPHFQNKGLIQSLLNDSTPVIPNISFEINFSVPYHGKGLPDGVFATYVQGLEHNMPLGGIKSLSSLAQELHLLTLQQAVLHNDESCEHEIIIFDVDRFETSADYLIMDGFKKLLNFIVVDDEIVGRPLTGISDIGEQNFAMNCRSRKVKGTPKRSTVLIVDE